MPASTSQRRTKPKVRRNSDVINRLAPCQVDVESDEGLRVRLSSWNDDGLTWPGDGNETGRAVSGRYLLSCRHVAKSVRCWMSVVL